jgi:TRAP-type transport system small permease protein
VSGFQDLLRKCARWLEIATAIPLVLAGATMVVVVLAGTVFRYVINDPLLWSEELARYLMIWIGLVGAAITTRHGEHIRINAIRRRLPRLLRLTGDVAVALAIAGFLWIMTVEGWSAALRGAQQSAPALGVSMLWPLLAVPVAGALMLAQHMLRTVLQLTGGLAEDEDTAGRSGL